MTRQCFFTNKSECAMVLHQHVLCALHYHQALDGTIDVMSVGIPNGTFETKGIVLGI